MRRTPGAAALLACVLALTVLPSPTAAQDAVELASGVTPAEVTVGERFRSVIRITVPTGVTAEFPSEFLTAADAVAAVEPVEATAAAERGEFTAVYTLVAWETGSPAEPVVGIRLRLPDGSERVLRAALPVPAVRSVLPADTAGIEPRPARSIVVLPAGFPWLWLALALAVLLLLAIAAAAWLRRRRPREDAGWTAATPRERALEELERARALRDGRGAEWKPYASAVSGAVRGYLDGLSPHWSDDLTTAELLSTVRSDGVEGERLARLDRVLSTSDGVKFAQRRLGPGEADALWDDARTVIMEVGAPDPRPADERRAVGAGHGGRS